MSWVIYLLGCALVTALAVALGAGLARLLARPGFDPDRFPSASARLGPLVDRGGYTWARLDRTPVRVRVRETQLELALVSEGASVPIRLRTHKRWHERLAALDGDADLERRFAACFELERGLEWPGPAGKHAVMALIEAEPALQRLVIRVGPRGVTLLASATPLGAATLDAALTAVLALAEVPERLRGFDAPQRPAGAGVLIGGSLAWALLVSVAATTTAGFAEHTEATVVARDESWLGNETSLIVRDADGRERGLLWVPSDLYLGCQPGQALRRERFSLRVSCDDQTSWHWIFLAQLPFVLLCWMGIVVGVLQLLAWRDESRERAASASA